MNLWEFAAQQAPQEPQTPQEAPGEGKSLAPLQIDQERRRDAEARALEVYREYQENTRKSEAAQAAILKGIQAGANPYRLLITACECIGHMTGNRSFADMAGAYIEEIHGRGLQELDALELELEGVRARLAMLRRPELEQTAAIRRAIAEHERREREIADAQRASRPA